MGRTVDTQKQQIRDRVPGKSLKDKMTHLYLENPERKVEEYMMKLSLTRDQVYGLKHIVKKALEEKGGTQGQSEQASARLESQYIQTSISEDELPGIDPVTSPTPPHSFSNMEDLLPFDIGTSTNEPAQQKPVEQTPPVYQQQLVQEPIQEPVYQQNAQENTYQQNHVQQPVQVPVQQPMHQQQSMYQQQPMQEQPVQQQQPIEQTYQQQSYQQPVYQQQQPVYQQESVEQVYQQQSMYQQPVQEPVQQYQIYQQQPIPQQKPMYQPIPVQQKPVQLPVQKPVQQLITPAPQLDFNLSDADGGTIKSFLAITSEKIKPGAKYTLELKLVEC